MADRSSSLVSGLHAVSIHGKDQENAKRPRKDQDLGSGLGLTYVSFSLLSLLDVGEG